MRPTCLAYYFPVACEADLVSSLKHHNIVLISFANAVAIKL
jgi:hypothetical protein